MARRKWQTFVALMMILCIGFVPVKAAEVDEPAPEPIIEEYVHILDLSSGLSISSTGLATCSGYARSGLSTDSVRLTVTLMRKNANGSWSTLVSWSTVHTWDDAIVNYYYVTSGHYYKVVTTAKIYTSSGAYVETATKTSNTVYY